MTKVQAEEVELSTQNLPGRGAVGHIGARLNVGKDVRSNTREGLLKMLFQHNSGWQCWGHEANAEVVLEYLFTDTMMKLDFAAQSIMCLLKCCSIIAPDSMLAKMFQMLLQRGCSKTAPTYTIEALLPSCNVDQCRVRRRLEMFWFYLDVWMRRLFHREDWARNPTPGWRGREIDQMLLQHRDTIEAPLPSCNVDVLH